MQLLQGKILIKGLNVVVYRIKLPFVEMLKYDKNHIFDENKGG
jgi:hypothetical protein